MSYNKLFKGILVVAFLFVFAGAFTPKVQAALTESQIQAILNLLESFGADSTIITNVETSLRGGTTAWCHTFNQGLRVGDSGSEVSALETALVAEGFSVTEHSSNFPAVFDERMASAVVGFQEKYREEVLAQWGLKYGTGYVGPATRTKLNSLYGCGVIQPICTQKDNSCCLGDVCSTSEIICITGTTPAFKGCSTNCKPQWECQPSTPSITVLSPNGGETWVVGETYNVTWTGSGSINTVMIGLQGPSSRTIGTDVSASLGKFTWMVPNDVTPGSTYKILIGDTASSLSDQSDNYFSIVEAGTNLAPVIDGLSAPSQLKVNETGTWTIKAHDPENGRLTYSVRWGDEVSALTTEQRSFSAGAGQTTTFTHSYSKTGNYTISFTVTDDKSQSAKTTTTVQVVSATTCTDTDGGKNYYVKGTATGQSTAGPGTFVGVDNCRLNGTQVDSCSGSGCNLFEYYCSGTTYVERDVYTCPYGCSDGACKPGITVLSPNGGEKWVAGETVTISWKSTGLSREYKTNVSIVDYSGKTPSFAAVATDLSGDAGTTTWNVWPITKIAPHEKYKIKIESCRIGECDYYSGGCKSECYADESDNYFSIVAAGS